MKQSPWETALTKFLNITSVIILCINAVAVNTQQYNKGYNIKQTYRVPITLSIPL